jgi:hypothetical protein
LAASPNSSPFGRQKFAGPAYDVPGRPGAPGAINTDILYQGNQPSTVIAKAVTSVATPGHIYELPAAG